MAPSNVKNPALYDKIHKKIKKKLKQKGRGWSAFASGHLVQAYKKAGGTYSGTRSKKKEGLTRWFEEKWVNVCKLPKIVSCGRADAKNLSYSELKKKYPYCRPSKKVSSSTPRTAKSLSTAQRKKMCSLKKKDPRKTRRL